MTKDNDKKKLPILNETKPFPTGKDYISFSQIYNFRECSYRFKLKYIDQIDLDDASIHTLFGSVIHDSIEKYLVNKTKTIDTELAINNFRQAIKTSNLKIDEKTIQEFENNIPDMLNQIPDWMNTQFPGWKLYAAEMPLYESVDKQNVFLKGFIDAIIEVPKKKGEGFEYKILDWKTAGFGWKLEQKTSFEKQLQLILYKKFFSQLKNIDLKDIKCGFVLVKRTVPKTRKPFDRLEFVPVSVGPITLNKGEIALHDMINRVKNGFFVKNRMACEPFCVYKNTEHCR